MTVVRLKLIFVVLTNCYLGTIALGVVKCWGSEGCLGSGMDTSAHVPVCSEDCFCVIRILSLYQFPDLFFPILLEVTLVLICF